MKNNKKGMLPILVVALLAILMLGVFLVGGLQFKETPLNPDGTEKALYRVACDVEVCEKSITGAYLKTYTCDRTLIKSRTYSIQTPPLTLWFTEEGNVRLLDRYGQIDKESFETGIWDDCITLYLSGDSYYDRVTIKLSNEKDEAQEEQVIRFE